MNNPALYDAVVSGVGGAGQQSWLTALHISDYDDFVVGCGAVALAVDAAIAPIIGGASYSQIALMQSIVYGVMTGRYPYFKQSSDYQQIGRSIAVLWQALNAVQTDEPNYLQGDGWPLADVGDVLTVSPGGIITAQPVGPLSVPGAVCEIELAVGLAAIQDSATIIPANAKICTASVEITFPYTPGTTIEVGRPGNPGLLLPTSDNLASYPGTYNLLENIPWGAIGAPVRVTLGGLPSFGSCLVVVQYSVPNL